MFIFGLKYITLNFFRVSYAGTLFVCFSTWLTARTEQIIVKGKGTMQTYWCDPATSNLSIKDLSSNDLEN